MVSKERETKLKKLRQIYYRDTNTRRRRVSQNTFDNIGRPIEQATFHAGKTMIAHIFIELENDSH